MRISDWSSDVCSSDLPGAIKREQAMILTIDNYPASAHRTALETMFADRKAQFVDFFDWDVPVVDGRFEIDQFDTAEAVYFVAIDEVGRHEASLRSEEHTSASSH